MRAATLVDHDSEGGPDDEAPPRRSRDPVLYQVPVDDAEPSPKPLRIVTGKTQVKATQTARRSSHTAFITHRTHQGLGCGPAF
jgi:hypothetical protein